MKKNKYYMNRELSWLQFNERVLNEAANPKVPLAERLTFASIYQSNLDEFFMVRVGTLMVQMNSKEEICDNKTKMTSREQVEAILEQVKELEKKKAKIYEQILGELEPQGIRIINFNKLSQMEGDFLEEYFNEHIMPFLSPTIVGKQQPFPFLENKKLYAIVLLETKNKKRRIGIVPCENSVFKRLIEIPTRPGNFMLCEELILHFLNKLFDRYTILEKSVLRITRNADIDAEEVKDEDLDYRDMMKNLIRERTRLSPVRLELTRKIDPEAENEIAGYLGIDLNHIIFVETPLDLSFVFGLQDYLRDKTELFYEKRSPRNPVSLSTKESIIRQIEEKDRLLFYPYESMKPFLMLLHEAAEDESVVSIKMTLYRVADKSKVVEALAEAAENGKEVVVLVELRARFDEANNIETSRRLEEAGCRIIYGLGKYKVHSKLCLITRKVKEEGTGEDICSYITQIGTGNYNEKTARLYTDFSLMTARKEIGAEAAAVFKNLQQGKTIRKTNHLLVAPNCLQNRILEMIDEEIKKAEQGRPAYIGIKINSLTDKTIIKKLVSASCHGVKIEMIIRGICCMVPGVKDKTENIRIISVVGRFLEHSRIYRFGTGEDEKIYISSADFMTRNTTRRVEVAAPVYDEEIKDRIRRIFDLIMKDNEKGKELRQDGKYVDREPGIEWLDSQDYFYREAYGELDGQAPVVME